MIDEKILDQVIPVPDLTELKDQRIQELSDAGFAIKNGTKIIRPVMICVVTVLIVKIVLGK